MKSISMKMLEELLSIDDLIGQVDKILKENKVMSILDGNLKSDMISCCELVLRLIEVNIDEYLKDIVVNNYFVSELLESFEN